MNKKKSTWPVDLIVNGELDRRARLTDEQIKRLNILIVDMQVQNQMEGVK